jgi:hypothetical protein
VLRRRFFFFDIFVDEPRHATAAKAAGRLVFGLTFRVTHKTAVKRLFSADKVVIIKSELAALAALQIFGHRLPSGCWSPPESFTPHGCSLRYAKKNSDEPLLGQQEIKWVVEKFEILLHGLDIIQSSVGNRPNVLNILRRIKPWR